jgi:predicted amidohydrolase
MRPEFTIYERSAHWTDMSGKKRIRIALAQLPVLADDLESNAREILDAIQWAGRRKADFIVTPESGLTGHHNRFSKKARDKAVEEIRAALRTARVTGIIGTCDKRGGRSYVEQLIIRRDGRMIGRQTKTVLASVDRGWATPGRSLNVYTDRGLKYGCLVCNDLWAVPLSGADVDPRLSKILAEKGARMIFCSSYSGCDPRFRPMHESNIMLRAMEGHLFIVSVNAAEKRPVNAVTGIMGPDGKWVVQCPRRGRQLTVADISIPPLADLIAAEEPGFVYVR